MWIPPVYSPVEPMSVLRAVLTRKDGAVRGLEADLRERFAATSALALGSGTQALQLAIEAGTSGRGTRNRVAVPAYGCYDILSACVGAGAEPVFYDLDPHTLGPDAPGFQQAVASVHAVVVANLYGFPIDWELVRTATRGRDVTVIEDAAQGVGSHWRESPGGTLGDLTVLSFGRGKGWTGGSGGALLLRTPPSGSGADPGEPTVSRVALLVRTLGQWALARPALYGLPARVPSLGLGETRYVPPRAPTRMHPSAAHLVRASADVARAEVAQRRRTAARLARNVDALGLERPHPPRGGTSSHLRMPVFSPSPRDAPDLRKGGLYPSYPRTLPELASELGLARSPPDQEEFPGAARLARSLLTVATHSRIDEATVSAALSLLVEGGGGSSRKGPPP